MRRVRRCVDGGMLRVYEKIIEYYGPYVLVRCSRYTNRRRQAQQIGVYGLITTCVVVTEVEQVGRLGRVIDIMVDVVGPDVVSGGEGETWCGTSDELLIVDGRMRKVAAALNALNRTLREVLVLHYVTGLAPEDLARLLQQPPEAVLARIGRAERRLAQWLGTPDVRSLLAQFAAGLDGGWMAEVAVCALDYLAGGVRRPRRRRRAGGRN